MIYVNQNPQIRDDVSNVQTIYGDSVPMLNLVSYEKNMYRQHGNIMPRDSVGSDDFNQSLEELDAVLAAFEPGTGDLSRSSYIGKFEPSDTLTRSSECRTPVPVFPIDCPNSITSSTLSTEGLPLFEAFQDVDSHIIASLPSPDSLLLNNNWPPLEDEAEEFTKRVNHRVEESATTLKRIPPPPPPKRNPSTRLSSVSISGVDNLSSSQLSSQIFKAEESVEEKPVDTSSHSVSEIIRNLNQQRKSLKDELIVAKPSLLGNNSCPANQEMTSNSVISINGLPFLNSPQPPKRTVSIARNPIEDPSLLSSLNTPPPPPPPCTFTGHHFIAESVPMLPRNPAVFSGSSLKSNFSLRRGSQIVHPSPEIAPIKANRSNSALIEQLKLGVTLKRIPKNDTVQLTGSIPVDTKIVDEPQISVNQAIPSLSSRSQDTKTLLMQDKEEDWNQVEQDFYQIEGIDVRTIEGHLDLPEGCPLWRRTILYKKNLHLVTEYKKVLEEEAQEKEKWAKVPEWKRYLLQQQRTKKTDVQMKSPEQIDESVKKYSDDYLNSLPDWKRSLLLKKINCAQSGEGGTTKV